MHLYCTFTFMIILLTHNGRCDKHNPSVIIVGAGAAGIAAATRLYRSGIENITILEAENRIGGRIYSVKHGNAYIDLGAEWCHGEKDNVVYNLVKDLNILQPDNEGVPNLYHSKFKLLDKTFTKEIVEIFQSGLNEEKTGYTKSLGEFMTSRYNETIEKNWGKDPEKLILAFHCTELLHKWVLGSEGAFSWFDVFADSDYEESEGNQELNWNGRGYKTILDVLMQKFPDPNNTIPIDDKVLLNKEVSEIIWENDGDNKQTSTARCTDGTSYGADHVIVTASLGVLKNRYETLFKPPLPNVKIKAIQELGIDAVLKIFFHFSNRWWAEHDFVGFSFIWSEEDLVQTAQSFPEGPKNNGKSWITAITEIIPLDTNPNLLSAWFTGEFVPEIELCSEETIINGIMYIFSKFLGEQYPNISRPDSIIFNNWYTNPHFRGTYSYQTIQSRSDNVSKEEILSQPLLTTNGKQTLLFAGEATNPTHYATVHGAIETGFREADRLIEIYK